MRPVLLPYQIRWVQDRSPVKIIEKSRRVGVSWATAAGAVLDAAEIDYTDNWYVGYNKEMALEYIRDAATWARAIDAECDEYEEIEILDDDDPERSILAYSINFASGGRIVALSSRPSNLRGKQGHVVIDEAAFHDDLAGLRKAAMAVLMWGGRVSIASTHNGKTNPFNKLIEDCRKKKIDYSLHRVTLDDALDEGLYQRIAEVGELDLGAEAQEKWRDAMIAAYGDDADEELFCIPTKSGGVYIGAGLVERAMVDGYEIIKLDLPAEFAFQPEKERIAEILLWCKTYLDLPLKRLDKQRLHSLGEDFGRVSDLTVLAPFAMQQDLKHKAPFLVELRRVPFESQKQIVFYICDRLPRFRKAAFDATGNGAYLAEVAAQRYGEERVEQVKFNAARYAEMLPLFKAAHEKGEIQYPKDADVLEDICSFEIIDGLPRLPKTKKRARDGEYRHGDAGIALLLGHHASRLPAQEYSYKSTSRGRMPIRKGIL